MLDRPQNFDFSGSDESIARPLRQSQGLEPAPPTTGVHPVMIKIALSAVAWFLAVTWLNFAGGVQVDLTLAVVMGIFVMFFMLFLLTASMVVDDRRWRQPKASFAEFLKDDVPIDTYTMRGNSNHSAACGISSGWHRDHFDLDDSPLRVVSTAARSYCRQATN
jgi:hypothetical protein